jgi:hypothetical protein
MEGLSVADRAKNAIDQAFFAFFLGLLDDLDYTAETFHSRE